MKCMRCGDTMMLADTGMLCNLCVQFGRLNEGARDYEKETSEEDPEGHGAVSSAPDREGQDR